MTKVGIVVMEDHRVDLSSFLVHKRSQLVESITQSLHGIYTYNTWYTVAGIIFHLETLTQGLQDA